MHFTRDESLARLERTVDAGVPVVGAGAGTGISAKFAERGGVDLLIIYNSGRYRMNGRGSLAGLLSIAGARGGERPRTDRTSREECVNASSSSSPVRKP